METTHQITLPCDTWRALSLFMAKNDVHYYLRGIAITHGGQYAVATDGHRMLAIRVADSKPGMADCIIPAETVTSALKVHKPADDITCQSVSGIPFATEGKFGPLAFEPVDALFPDWQRVIPRDGFTGEAGFFNAEYLRDAQRAYRLLTGNKVALLPLAHRGPDNPGAAFGRTAAEQPFGIVIMPFRGESIHEEILADLFPNKAADKAA